MLTDAVNRVLRGANRELLDPNAKKVFLWNWDRLQSEAGRLYDVGLVADTSAVAGSVLAFHTQMHGTLRVGLNSVQIFGRLYHTTMRKNGTPCAVKIGMGSPGYTGCMLVDGSAVL